MKPIEKKTQKRQTERTERVTNGRALQISKLIFQYIWQEVSP